MGKLEEAIADFREVVGKDPRNSKYRVPLCHAMVNNGGVDQALQGKSTNQSSLKI